MIQIQKLFLCLGFPVFPSHLTSPPRRSGVQLFESMRKQILARRSSNSHVSSSHPPSAVAIDLSMPRGHACILLPGSPLESRGAKHLCPEPKVRILEPLQGPYTMQLHGLFGADQTSCSHPSSPKACIFWDSECRAPQTLSIYLYLYRICEESTTKTGYYTMLCYTMLYYAILCYTMLYYTMLYYTILYYTMVLGLLGRACSSPGQQ